MVIQRLRKSKFVRLFDKTPQDVLCPHFYELILSNGCPYNCSYCYLQLTFRGQSDPTLFTNSWCEVEKELEQVTTGVFSTGELADSLAIVPPLLSHALEYFDSQTKRNLLLTTKSSNTAILLKRSPSPNTIVSFSINSPVIAKRYEHSAPDPIERLEAAGELRTRGWRIRIRLDPIIKDDGLSGYRDICSRIANIKPEMVTLGTLRQYPGLMNYAPHAPISGLARSPDGRMRYSIADRKQAYLRIADWLGFQPSLCKETKRLWGELGWHFYGCNCTPNGLQKS